MAPAAPLLQVEDLRIAVPTDDGRRTTVEGVSFGLERGRSLGLVGESGSGKTLTCRALLGILPHGCTQAGGTIQFDGQSSPRSTSAPGDGSAAPGSAPSSRTPPPTSTLRSRSVAS